MSNPEALMEMIMDAIYNTCKYCSGIMATVQADIGMIVQCQDCFSFSIVEGMDGSG